MQKRMVVVAHVILGAAVAHAPAQTRNLRSDLADLNIRLRTDHYAISGTIGDDRIAEYGRALEYIYREYAAGFEELIAEQDARLDQADEPTDPSGATRRTQSGSETEKDPTPNAASSGDNTSSPPDVRFKVVVLSTDAEYREFTRAYFGGWTEHSRGLFVPTAQLLIIRDEPASRETYETLFHEAFHQFVNRYLPAAPIWVNEGLATYYGTARPTAQGLVFDRPRTVFFEVVGDAADARQLIPLGDLMQVTPDTFYARTPVAGINFDRATLHYAQSYTLVAYLLEDAAGRDHLRAYLRALASAQSPQDVRRVTQENFPDSLLKALVKGWLDMVRRY